MSTPRAPKAPAKKPAVKVSPARKGQPQGKKATGQASETPATAAPRVRTDWEAVERDYRVGKMTLREIAAKHAATAARVCQVAKERGWTRGDLRKTVNEATQALLVAEQVNGEVNRVKQGLNEAVLGAAELNKQVILRHRDRIQRTTDVAMRMLDELDATTTKADQLEELLAIVGKDLDALELASLKQKFHGLMKLHSRIASVQKLTTALRDAQNLEAQAFGNIYEGDKSAGDETQNLSDEELDGAIAQIKGKLGL